MDPNADHIPTYVEVDFNNACNLRCKYCFTNSPKGDHVTEYLDYDAIARLADEADELGYFEFDLQGGELLLQPKKLFKVLEAIKPERFYLYLTTNGYYLDEKMANRLAEAQVSRVSVSIDSMDEKIHDEIRGRKDSWRRAMEGLKHVQKAGIDPYLNITVGHYNAHTDHLKQLLDYSKDQKYKTLLNVAVPAGMWQKAEDIICDDKDRQYLRKIRKEYKNLVRNIWNPFDRSYEGILGCTTVNRLYITPIGDVLVCPYVHIKIGNIFELTNQSINETLSRTLITSITTLLALLSIFFFGGEILKGFSLAMILGVVFGTYSSIYIANPILVLLKVSQRTIVKEEKD